MSGPVVQADLLIMGGHVLTMDENFAEIADGAIAVVGDRIAWIGPAREAALLMAPRRIDASGCIIMPGLINTHCHAAMTLFRGLADDRPLEGFLNTVWAAEAAHVTPHSVAAAAALGAAEMALGGITHFVDMYWHPEATIAAAQKIGLGLTSGPVFVGFDGVDRQAWSDRLSRARSFVERHRGTAGLDLMLMPHAAYTMDSDKLRAVSDLAMTLEIGIHIHGAEARWEMQMVAQQYAGATPLGVFERTGVLDRAALIAHAVHLTPAEIDLLARRGTAISHCPLSNAKLASGTAPIAKLREAGVKLSLGTDGAASGNDLDLWKAMRHAGFMQILATQDPQILPARELLAMATRGGAAAIGKANETGTLTQGKRADMIVIDMAAPHLTPSFDPYSTLVYSAGREDVAHVIASGRQVVCNRRLCADISQDLAVVRTVARALTSRKDSL